MVEMKGDGDGDVAVFDIAFDHADNRVKSAHVFGGAFADAEDDRGFELLGLFEDSLCPFDVINIELTDGVLLF